MYRESVQSDTYLYLTNQRLFLFDNVIDNDKIEFFNLIGFTKIEKFENRIIIDINGKEPLILTFLDETEFVQAFLIKLETLTTPIIRSNIEKSERIKEDRKLKKTRRVLVSILILVVIGVVAFGSTVAYRSYVISQEEATKEEQFVKKEERQKEIKKSISKIKKQIIFGKGYKKRLETYATYLKDLNTTIGTIDISDKTTNWNELNKTINEKSISFKEIKISNEDMLDYGIYINQKKNYIHSKSKIINQNIEDILKNMIEGIEDKFTESTSVMMITIKETGEDTLQLISKLKDLIDTEKELLNDKMMELKAELKEA